MSNIQYRRSAHKEKQVTQTPTEKDTSLKGTLVSVLLLGGFIIISWISVFTLFISRN